MEAVMLHQNRKLDRQWSSHPSELFYPSFSLSSSFNGGSVPYPPPFLFQAPSPPMNPRAHHYQNQQPPLLPLPMQNPYQNNNRRVNNKITRHQSLSVKKSNFSGAGPKREKPRPNETVSSGNNRLGPEPKDVPKVLFNTDTEFVASNVVSPPPSSLPLPTFFIRPKLSCKSEAVDAGASDGLRRSLRLR